MNKNRKKVLKVLIFFVFLFQDTMFQAQEIVPQRSLITLCKHTMNRLVQSICCGLFGNELVDKEIKKMVDKARIDFGITQDRPVYYINDPGCFDQFSSFTWFGSWFNRNNWHAMNESEKIFSVYHEIGHEYLNHPLKQSIFWAAISGAGMVLLIKVMRPDPFVLATLHSKIGTCCGLLFTNVVLTLIIGFWYNRLCETMADIQAVRVLKRIGYGFVIEDYIQFLKDNQPEKIFDPEDPEREINSPFFNSIHQQIKYLEKEYNKADTI